MLKKLIKTSELKDIKKPSEYTTLHNNLLYRAKKSKIPLLISSDIRVDEDLNVFVDKKLVTSDSAYFLVSYSPAVMPLLKVLDYVAESYGSSKELVDNKPLLRIFLSKKGIPVPEFTVGLPLDSGYPCIVRKKDASSNNDLRLVEKEEELYEAIDGKDSPLVEEIVGLDRVVPVTYMVWTYFYKPVAIIAKMLREYEGDLGWVIPDVKNMFSIPLYPVENIKLDAFKTLRVKDITPYRPELTPDFLTVNEGNKALGYSALDDVPSFYEVDKNSLVFDQKKMESWNVYNLAEATSKVLKLGYCRIDIRIDDKKAPVVVDVKGYSGYHSNPFPFHLLCNFPSRSEQIWHMLHKHYKLFGELNEPSRLGENNVKSRRKNSLTEYTCKKCKIKFLANFATELCFDCRKIRRK